MKNNQKNTILLALTGFVLFLVGGYLFVTKANFISEVGEKANEVAEAGGELNSLVEEYNNERINRIEELVRKDLYGDEVEDNVCGVVAEAAIVDVEQLLVKEGWNIFSLGRNSLFFDYPSVEWFVQSESGTEGGQLIITTTADGNIEEGAPWAKITVGEYKRTQEESLLDWLERVTSDQKEGVPVTEKTIQYIEIGESVFLGSIFFEENIWVGKKSVFAEVSAEDVFSATLEIKNMNPDSELLGRFEQVFYTMMESLEVK